MALRQRGSRNRWAGALLVAALAGTVTIGAASPSSAVEPSNDSAAVAYQLSSTHDGHQIDPDFAGPAQSVLWSKDLGGKVGYPLIVGDRVFVDVANSGPNGTTASGTTVAAYDRRSGALLWGPVAIGGSYSFGAIAYDNGRVFAVDYNGEITALDAATGNQVWFKALTGQYSFTSPPTVVNGTLYLGGAGSGGTLYAVDEATGSVLWTAGVANGDHSSPAVDSSGVYVSYACEQTYSFTAAGQLRWRHSTNCSGGGGRTPVLHDGRVYVRDSAAHGPAVLSETDGTQVRAYTATSAPALDDTTMVATSSGSLISYDTATNVVRWSHSPEGGTFTSAPLIVNGYVVEGDSLGNVHLFDADSGAEVWQASAGTSIAEPDENSAGVLSGLAEAQGVLAVPAGTHLTVFGASRVWFRSAPAAGTVIGRSANFTFDSNLPGGTLTCRLDGATIAPCTSPLTLSGLSNGPHTLAVEASAGTNIQSAQTSFTTDAIAPALSVQTTNQFANAWTTVRSWSARDASTGVMSYDVRYRTASAQSAFGAYQQPASLQATKATSLNLHPSPGTTVCISVRVRDRVGNVSGWSADKCQTVLLDDRALSTSGPWLRHSGAAGFGAGTYTATSTRGATLSLHGVHGRRLEIVATTCPTCGRVSVSFPGMRTTVLNLHSTKTVKQAFFVLPQLTAAATGTLTLSTLDSGRPVGIDAVAVWHS